MPQMNRTTHAVGMLHLGTATLREKAIISYQRILLGDQNTSSAQCRFEWTAYTEKGGHAYAGGAVSCTERCP